ncbi:hypothetical protein AAU01_24070 [Paenarthrobacter aurescens]|uniref:Uncharacterized protein n=1 Tax=Paenarthrobacter aurescens TaxID=43663 RepID=A0A4Y3ND70_PAEAU|nr:hypothetical protein AAU01_24070 [Paenarthrobacter aurescens]
MVKSPAAAIAGETPSISDPAPTTTARAAAGVRITARCRDGGIRGMTVESFLGPGVFSRRPKRPHDSDTDIQCSLASPGPPSRRHATRREGRGKPAFQ